MNRTCYTSQFALLYGYVYDEFISPALLKWKPENEKKKQTEEAKEKEREREEENEKYKSKANGRRKMELKEEKMTSKFI